MQIYQKWVEHQRTVCIYWEKNSNILQKYKKKVKLVPKNLPKNVSLFLSMYLCFKQTKQMKET